MLSWRLSYSWCSRPHPPDAPIICCSGPSGRESCSSQWHHMWSFSLLFAWPQSETPPISSTQQQQRSAQQQPIESSSQDRLGAGSHTIESSLKTDWGQITTQEISTAGINVWVGSDERKGGFESMGLVFSLPFFLQYAPRECARHVDHTSHLLLDLQVMHPEREQRRKKE
jgi:hypothetical protein